MDGENLHKTHKTNPEGSSVDIVDDPGGVKSRAQGHFVDFVHEFGRTVAFVRRLAEEGVLIRLAEDGGIEVDAPGGWLADSRIAKLRERRESLRLFIELAMDRGSLESVESILACCDCLDALVASKLREHGGGAVGASDSTLELSQLFECEPFDEVPLSDVPQCFVCDRLCDRVNGLGLWYCSRCDPLAKTRERKTTDALKVRRRWGRD